MVTIGKEEYLRAAQLFYWATIAQYAAWFTGSTEWHTRSEVMLKRLSEEGKLKTFQPSKFSPIYYAAPRVKNTEIAHGVACTEGLVRFWRSDPSGIVIPSRRFRGMGNVPEWGIQYGTGTLLLYEFCTADNFRRVLKPKLQKYHSNLAKIEAKFSARGVVVFVCDVSRARVKSFIERCGPTGEAFFFTDYATFKAVPIGDQLLARIYLWEDGKEYGRRSLPDQPELWTPTHTSRLRCKMKPPRR